MNTTVNQDIARKYLLDYLECAIWSSINWHTDEPLDKDYGICDLTDDAREQCESDFVDFLDYCDEQTPDWFDRLPDWYGFDRLAHDFWLTRNRHGAGFWDRGLGKLGTELTDHAHTFGSAEFYINENDQLEVA